MKHGVNPEFFDLIEDHGLEVEDVVNTFKAVEKRKKVFTHFHLTSADLAEVCRQAYMIGRREAAFPVLDLDYRVQCVLREIENQIERIELL